MKVTNTDKRKHLVYNAGFKYTVKRGETIDLPERIALAMMRRHPCLKICSEEKKVARKVVLADRAKRKAKRMAKLPTITLSPDQ